jgi:hypothetical protein
MSALGELHRVQCAKGIFRRSLSGKLSEELASEFLPTAQSAEVQRRDTARVPPIGKYASFHNKLRCGTEAALDVPLELNEPLE